MRLWCYIVSFLSVAALNAQNIYQPKGWVLYDKQDTTGKWHLGALDKRQHCAVGFVAGAWITSVAKSKGCKHPKLIGFLSVLAIGYAKELYDVKRGSGTAEHADALWTAAGGLAGSYTIRW